MASKSFPKIDDDDEGQMAQQELHFSKEQIEMSRDVMKENVARTQMSDTRDKNTISFDSQKKKKEESTNGCKSNGT